MTMMLTATKKETIVATIKTTGKITTMFWKHPRFIDIQMLTRFQLIKIDYFCNAVVSRSAVFV